MILARLLKACTGARIGLARRHLELALGTTHDATERERILDRSLDHFVSMAWWIWRSGSWTDDEYRSRVTHLEDEARRFDDICSRESGVIFITAHLGNWELATRWIAERFPRPLHVIAKDLRPAWLDRYAVRRREAFGARVIKKDEAARGVLGALRQSEAVGILMDQNRPDGVFVPFFGRLAGTSALPATFALRTGAAVVPVACFHEGRGRFRMRLRPEIDFSDLADTSRDEAQVEATRRCNEALEQLILEEPEQWLWTHRRYKACAEGQEPLQPLTLA